MKYIMQILILLSLSLSAACTLQDGEKLYDEKEYTRVLKCLDEIDVKDEEYIRLDMLLAKSATALGKLDLAISAYERVLIEDPSYVQAEINLIPLYRSDVLTEELDLEVKSLLKGRLTTEQRAILEQFNQDAMSRKKQKFLANVSVSMGYDSNVNTSPVQTKLNSYYMNIGTSNNSISGKVSSLFMNTQVDLLYWKSLDENADWYLRGDTSFLYQNNFSAHNFDLKYTRVSFGLGHTKGKMNFYFPMVYDRMHYLQRELAQSYGIEPSVVLSLDNGYYTSFNFKYSKKDYIQSSDTVRDNTTYTLGASIYRTFSTHDYFAKIRYAKMSSDENILRFIDTDIYYLDIGGSYTINHHLFIEGEYMFRYADYEDALLLSTVKRQDKYHKLELKLRYQLKKLIQLSYGIKYITNDSNYVPADYDKYINEFTLDYKF